MNEIYEYIRKYKDTNKRHPKISVLAKRFGMTKEEMRYELEKLEKRGYLTLLKTEKGNIRKTKTNKKEDIIKQTKKTINKQPENDFCQVFDMARSPNFMKS